MCGFTGYIGNTEYSESVIEKMIGILEHRGPDHLQSKKFKLDEKFISIAHSRLSILDLNSRSHQPYQYRNHSIVYNGEIYNFHEIRKELEVKGVSFETEGDTEVVIKAIVHLGMHDALEKFRGMFAIALLDHETKKLYLVRDRVGVKPLYYYHDDENLIFASELKALSLHPAFEKKISPLGLTNYLKYGFVTGKQSIFQKCFRVEPGQVLTYCIEHHKVSKETYWSLKRAFTQEKISISKEEAELELKSILEEAFSLRMVSDVPVGIFLSSGYDSTCVTAILSQKYKNLNTFTIGFSDPKENEANHAKKIAAHLGTHHHELYCDEGEALSLVDKMIDIYDEPFGDSSAIPTTLVSAFAKKKVKVSLSADGGDELFFGYKRYLMIEKIRSNRWLNNRVILNLIKATSPIIKGLGQLFSIYNLDTRIGKIVKIIESENYYSALEETIKIFPDEEVEQLTNLSSVSKKDVNFPEKDIQGMQFWDASHYLPDDILVKVDRATMANSLEGREPFLDHKIIEYATKLPIDMLYSNNGGKSIIKDIVHKLIPEDLLNRPKKGFSVPLRKWMCGPMRAQIEKLITPVTLKDFPELDHEQVLKIKSSFFETPDKINPHKLWLLFIYINWKRKWGL